MPVRARLSPDQAQEAVKLQAQFWTQDRIATHLGVHRNTVQRYLARINARSFQRLEKRSASIKAKQVTQLETLASEAYEAWLHSKTPKEVNRDTDSSGAEGSSSSSMRETSTHHADPGLLNQARGALADVRKILGLDAEGTAAVVGKVKVEIEFVDGDTDSPEDQTPQAPPGADAGGSADGPV